MNPLHIDLRREKGHWKMRVRSAPMKCGRLDLVYAAEYPKSRSVVECSYEKSYWLGTVYQRQNMRALSKGDGLAAHRYNLCQISSKGLRGLLPTRCVCHFAQWQKLTHCSTSYSPISEKFNQSAYEGKDFWFQQQSIRSLCDIWTYVQGYSSHYPHLSFIRL